MTGTGLQRRSGRRARAAISCVLALSVCVMTAAFAQDATRPRAFSVTTERTLYPLRRLGEGLYLVQGDTGKGAEGRPNAGFVVTRAGIVTIGGLASPAQARAVMRTIRTVSKAPLRYLVLYAHHPDMMFGAIEFKRAGATIVAHPDSRVLAAEGGPDAMMADWHSVVGLQELLGFEFANAPDRPVTGWDTLRLGGTTMVAIHPGKAHSRGDLMLWVPATGVLFAGDILLEDGITMVVDGNSATLLKTLDLIDSLAPRVVVPGHGRVTSDPRYLTRITREYLVALRDSMGAEVRRGTSQRRTVEAFPPADERRPVTRNSRIRRNAARVYQEMEREALGMEEE